MKRIENYIKEKLFKISIKSVDSKLTRKMYGMTVPAFVIHKKILIGDYCPFSFASTTQAVTEYDIWESKHLSKAIDYQESAYLSKCPNVRATLLVYVSLIVENALKQLIIKYYALRN